MVNLKDLCNDPEYDRKLKQSLHDMAEECRLKLIDDIIENGWHRRRSFTLLPSLHIMSEKNG